MKTVENAGLLHTQEVRGSSPCAHTIFFKRLPVPVILGERNSDIGHLLFSASVCDCAKIHAARWPRNLDESDPR